MRSSATYARVASTVGGRSNRSAASTTRCSSPGLIHSTRTGGNQRRYERSELRRVSFIRISAQVGIPLETIKEAHLQLDELVSAARQYTDDVAERANAIGVSPNGKAKAVVESSGIPDYPANWETVEATVAAIVEILGEFIKRLRKRIDELDKTDLVSQDLLIEIAAELEKQHWMWQAQTA